MTPYNFPEANTTFGPPSDLDESQCQSVRGYVGNVQGGSCDGVPIVVVAYHPSAEEKLALRLGQPLFLTFLGGLPPHFATVSFESATHPL